jgi:hypothetical protein
MNAGIQESRDGFARNAILEERHCWHRIEETVVRTGATDAGKNRTRFVARHHANSAHARPQCEAKTFEQKEVKLHKCALT